MQNFLFILSGIFILFGYIHAYRDSKKTLINFKKEYNERRHRLQNDS